jgi:hypothetical protein
MKKIYSVIFVFILSAVSLVGYGQISQGGLPFSFQHQELVKSAIPVVQMPAIDINRLMAEDSLNDKYKDIPWRFGENLYVNLNLQNSGTWDSLQNGDKLWRLGIKCQGAFTINLTFDNYQLPPGATLFIYNLDKSHVIGAFTEINNQADKVFATTLVKGEEITIEYYEPSNPAFHGDLNLYRVTHGYRDGYGYIKDFGTSGACENNVNCPEAAGWENQVKSACMLVSGGSGFCSGAIVNNTNQDGIPYILTANHCYSDPSSWVFWFNWQSPTCANPGTSPAYNSISGATLKARNASSDFCLVQMNTTPPASYAVYYAGWNRENVAATSGACVHHPDGDIKKISYSNTAFTSDTYSGTPADSHWKVNWSDGVTEPGSSGSPIFDQNHRIVGQLHGGPSACDASQLWDFYGKFSMSWDYGTTSATRLKDWLDPTNISDNTLDGWDPNAFVPVVITLAASSVTANTATLNGTVNPNTYTTMYHFEWGTTTSYGNSTTSTSAGSGSSPVPVTAPLTGLITGTTYHFRLVGVNSQGTANGSDLTFTPGGASVTTTAASAITTTTATSGGNVTSDGGVSVTAKGVCWSTTANPTIAGSHTTNGSGTGVFTSSITGLSASTLYHVRAYATNASSVTYYGEDLQFTTSCGIITALPFNEGFEASALRPNCWTEENSNPAWLFVTGNASSNPAIAHTGTKNACLKDNTASANINKLITPVFDFTGFTNIQLSFWHTQQLWGSDQDELKIYYKNSSGGSWILLQSYTTNITSWTQETMSLPGTGAYYQVAFEGSAKYGYGVCIDDIQVTGTSGSPTLNVTPANQNVTAIAGTTSFTVVSNSYWTVTSDQTWCTVTPSGTGNGSLTATYSQNPTTVSRVATLTVVVAGLSPISVTVTQAGSAPSLAVTPNNQNVPATAGTTTFTVTSTVNWTSTSDQTWCTLTPSGTGNGTISANYLENTSLAARIATITVSASGLSSQTVTITQAGAGPTLSLNPSNQNVTAPAGTTSFTVTSNSSWTASSGASWCTVTPTGTGNGTITANYLENTSVDLRVAIITVSVSGLPAHTVTVTQSGIEPTLIVAPLSRDVTYPAGTTNFTVTSNSGWTAWSDASWCTVTSSGTGSGQLIATYEENTLSYPRTANIFVALTGAAPLIVTVNQEGTVSVQDIHVGELQIFPNPTTGIFTIVTAKDGQNSMDVTIHTMQGQTILKKQCKGATEYQIDLSSAAQGTYNITVVTENSVLTRKLVILKK